MTNEEAKCKIRTLLEIGGSDGFDYREIEALEMAIRALSSWDRYSYELWKTAYVRGCNDVLDKVRAEVERLNPIDYGSMYSYESHNGAKYMKDDVLRFIDNYKSESEDAE